MRTFSDRPIPSMMTEDKTLFMRGAPHYEMQRVASSGSNHGSPGVPRKHERGIDQHKEGDHLNSLLEILGKQLEDAQSALAAQHEGALQIVAACTQAGPQLNLDVLLSERPKTANAQQSLHAKAADDAAGPVNSEQDVMSQSPTGSGSKKLISIQTQSTAMDLGAAPWRHESRGQPLRPESCGQAGKMTPWRPDSRGQPGKAVPAPADAAPTISLPGQSIKEQLDNVEEDAENDDVRSLPNLPVKHWTIKEAQQRSSQASQDNDKQAFELLPIWRRQAKKVKKTHTKSSAVSSTLNMVDKSRKEVYEETDDTEPLEVHKAQGPARLFILHPYSMVRGIWDFFSLFLVLYDMVIIPMEFFDLKEEHSSFLQGMSWTTRIFWTADIPISFISGYVTNKGAIEMRPIPICRKYSRSWLPLDLMVVGVDWIEVVLKTLPGLGVARFFKSGRIFRIMRMIRLLRMARMSEVITLLSERLSSERLVVIIDIMKLMVIMLGSGHFIACIWYLIGNGPGTNDWVSTFGFEDKPLEFRYVMSLRWAISQFAGGMDEVTPQNLDEHLYAMFVYLMAFWSGAVFLSILTSSMTQLYIMGSQATQQLTTLKRYLSQNQISKGLALRVHRNAQHAMAVRQRAMPEDAVGLVDLVSEPLRVELHFEMYSPKLSVHPFLAKYTRECPHVLRKVCHSAMSMTMDSLGDVLFHPGEVAERMIIVNNGALEYSFCEPGTAGNTSTTKVGPNQWLSEMALWTNWAHRGMLTAVGDSLLFLLDAKKFQAIVGHFEHVGFNPQDYAAKFVHLMNNSATEVTDLPFAGQEAKLLQPTFHRSWGRVGSHIGSLSSMVSRQSRFLASESRDASRENSLVRMSKEAEEDVELVKVRQAKQSKEEPPAFEHRRVSAENNNEFHRESPSTLSHRRVSPEAQAWYLNADVEEEEV